MELRVGYIKNQVMALGPGTRFVIWTQGCSRRCKGCASPEFQPFEGGYLIETGQVAEMICSTNSVDGITISGGEPFLQAVALYELTNIVKKERPEVNVIVFTGNQLEHIVDEDGVKFLSNIDLLIDGEYVRELNNNQGLRGSTNQRFHFLTQRLLPYRDELKQGNRNTEVHWIDSSKQKIVKIGVPCSNRNH